MEMRCFCKILHISYKDHITNEEVHSRIEASISSFEEPLTMVKKCKLKWYGHICFSTGFTKTNLQDTVMERRRRGSQCKRWEDNVKEWIDLSFGRSQKAVMDIVTWWEIVTLSVVLPMTYGSRDK